MVNVYLQKTDGGWIHCLAIPLEDIERLSLRPLKWLRFVTFTIVGAKGHLSDTPGGNVVDYGNISLADLTEDDKYYFTPEGSYHFVDFYGLNDHITSTSLTQRRSTFRNDVSLRDAGCCVITQNYASLCDAAHIIPHCKGDEYISFVVSDRSVLYEDQQFPPENGIDINSTQNGVFLRKDLHAQFGDAMSAFLKTPNFALNPADVPRIEPGGMPTSRITLQHIIPPIGLFLIPQCDVRADWSSPLAPPSILLDYVYGVAAINRWGVNDIHQMMTERHVAAFSHIPPFHYSPPTSDDEEVIESNDAADPDYKPPGAGYRHRTHDRSKESGLSRAMDFAFEFSMYLKGYPPGTTLAMVRQKQEEEAELRSRQAGREVVQRWLQTGAGTSNTQE